MNVHSTIDLNRHAGGERQIARRQSGNRPPYILVGEGELRARRRRGLGRQVFGRDLVDCSVADYDIELAPCQGDNDAAADPAHATRHSRDSAR
jgi:hypothetical protein